MQLPPLTVLEKNFEKIGLLNNDEIITLINVSNALYDLPGPVNGITVTRQEEVHQQVQGLLSVVCRNVADFLQYSPTPKPWEPATPPRKTSWNGV